MKPNSKTAKTGSPRRRPPTGGYARGEEQRQRIIGAALKVFADEGYERASTRQIAKAAGVNPPALQYYFDSKEGLHRACAEFIVEHMTRLMTEPLAEAGAALAHGLEPAAAVDALCDVLDALVDASLFSRNVPEWSRFAARAQSEDGPAGPHLKERISGPIIDVCARLIARALEQTIDEGVRLRVSLILSQVSAFNVHRDSTLARLGWRDFDGPRRTVVKTLLRAHTRGALGFAPEPRRD